MQILWIQSLEEYKTCCTKKHRLKSVIMDGIFLFIKKNISSFLGQKSNGDTTLLSKHDTSLCDRYTWTCIFTHGNESAVWHRSVYHITERYERFHYAYAPATHEHTSLHMVTRVLYDTDRFTILRRGMKDSTTHMQQLHMNIHLYTW